MPAVIGRPGLRGVGVAAIAILLQASFAPAALLAGDPTIFRHPVYGGAEAVFGTCPDVAEVEQIPAGTVCEETYVIFLRSYAAFEGGSISRAHAPWGIFAQTVRLEFAGSGQEPNVTVLREGFGIIPDEVPGTAAVDTPHLQTATLDVQVPMSDGSTYELAATWHAATERMHFGNDGPATGLPRHYVDRCVTVVALGHQKFVYAAMSGTLNGEPVHSYTSTNAAAIFNNNFTYITVPHGGC
jgi:hypothetical protein